jgi:hypothetical protein
MLIQGTYFDVRVGPSRARVDIRQESLIPELLQGSVCLKGWVFALLYSCACSSGIYD